MKSQITHLLRQYTCPQIIGLDTISLGFLVYIDAVCRLWTSRELHQALVGGASPAKWTLFCLTGHSHQKWPTNLCCMTERPSAFAFCFKASVCELLGDEYLISWLLSARMHLSRTAMDITTSPPSHTWLTYCPLRLPARPPPTHPVDGCNVTLKKTIFEKPHPSPRGASSTQNMSNNS